MSIFKVYKNFIYKVIHRLQEDNILPQGLILDAVTVETPRDITHGDLATNVAMVLCKQAKMKPIDLAQILLLYIKEFEGIISAEIAGAGFINMRLTDDVLYDELKIILKNKIDYGKNILGKDIQINLEYVSANPTGPLHVGHLRGAVFGDALANLLAFSGYKITKEYYINDAGKQVEILAQSAFLRYREALGENIGDIPEGFYPGEYLKDVGIALKNEYGDSLLNVEEVSRTSIIQQKAVEAMMQSIRDDLSLLNIKHDIFTSEKKLVESGKVQEAFDKLVEQGYIYEGTLEPPKGKLPDDWEERSQTLFKSTSFGDDIDRPLKKSDGRWTYFASDIACHLDKVQRNSNILIDVWGADHGGYVKRMQAATKAITNSQAQLKVCLCQIVHLYKNGEPYKMSKRSGSFVTLRDVLDEVGPDVVRFIMLTRKNDAQLDFDFQKVTEQSKDNPVFYVQYAHARICSVLKNAKDVLGNFSDEDLVNTDTSLLIDETEKELIKKMIQFPRMIEQASEAYEPHRVAFFLHELASLFHSHWNKGKENNTLKFIIHDNLALTRARLAMIRAVAIVIAAGLSILGVKPMQKMY